MRALSEAGFDVTGMGRDEVMARQVLPQAKWLIRDLAKISTDEWRTILTGVDVVVNAAGALQDGARDDLSAIHETMVERLVVALEGRSTRLVQISAAGVSEDASTEFFRSKARGDATIRRSGAHWVILRPALVIGPAAYGGTALIRAAAALPVLALDILPEASIRTVFTDDLAQAVVLAAKGVIPSGTVADLAEAAARSLPDTICAFRRWQGFPEPWLRAKVPPVVLWAISRVADALGHLGWRSPLRSNAVRVLKDGIHGDPAAWKAVGGNRIRSLEEGLAAMPATLQERWFARLYLAFPVVIALLSVFWLCSGLIALAYFEAARDVLTMHGMDGALAGLVVAGGALADIFLGAAILWRPWTRHASLGMILLSLAYLVGGTLMAPDLWADPVGPFVKILPGMGLAIVSLAMASER